MKFKQHDYIVEKLTTALRVLATHPGDVRKRLIRAHASFRTLQAKDFPESLQPDWIWIMQELTKSGKVISCEGEIIKDSVENTMSRIRNKTRTAIATRIYNIYRSVTDP